MLEISEYKYSSKDDGRHPFANKGWEYYETVFKVGNKSYKGLLNIANGDNGKLLYDITQIKETTIPYSVKTVSTNSSSSTNSIASQNENVNTTTKYSMQESGNDTQNSNKWQEYLDNHYKPTGTRTKLANIAPTANNNIAETANIGYNTIESESGINGKQETIKSNDQRGTTGLFSRYEGRSANDTGYQGNNEEQITRTKQEEIEYIKKPQNQITELNNEQSKIKEAFESKGVKVVYYSLDSNKGGYYDNGTLYINQNNATNKQQLDEATHEYAHYLIRDNIEFNQKITSIAEKIVKNEEQGTSEAVRNYIMDREENINIEDLDKIYQVAVEEILSDYAVDIRNNVDFNTDNQYGVDNNILNEYETILKDYLPDMNLENSDKSSFSFTQEKTSSEEQPKFNKNDILMQEGKWSKANKEKQYAKYKENIIKDNEKIINNMIAYKNEAIRNLENKIADKTKVLNSKKDKTTKAYIQLQAQIKNLEARRTKIENEYNHRIDKFYEKNTREKVNKEVQNKMKSDAREVLADEIRPLISDMSLYKDKKIGWLYNRETAQRNIEDIVQDKELAREINKTIFDPVQKHQAEKTRQINKDFKQINNLNLDKNKKYNYILKEQDKSIKIDEATIAQLYIENKISLDEIESRYGISRTRITEISKVFNDILEKLYIQMNNETIKYGYVPIGKIKNYFPHFFENKPDSIIGKIAGYFGIDTTNQSLPTEIAGRTEEFKPGRTWNSNIQQRTTNKTDYDALKALEKYIQGAYDIIYTTEDIQRLRTFSRELRYKYSNKALQNNIDFINKNNDLTQEEKDIAITALFDNNKNEVPNFATWLDEYTNVLANKKSSADRDMEKNIGRNIYTSMSNIESRIASNTIGGNISVSITNLAPIFQAMGTTSPKYVMGSILNVVKNNLKGLSGKKDLSFIDNSTFLTNRLGTDNIAKKTVTKNMSDTASILMNALDHFTSETIVQAKYLENLNKGMTQEQALDNADRYASRLMADRSKGALPIVFNSKNPLNKLINMFQVESNNIISNYFKDIPRNSKSKAEITYQYGKLMVASYCFNTMAMAIRGGNEVLPDPIRIVSYLATMLFNDNEDEKEKAKNNLIENIISTTPFLSNVAGVFGIEDVGRVPISNAMPNLKNIFSIFDNENSNEYKKEIAIKELSKPLLYLGLPTGGAQLKKIIEGIIAVNKKGSYKTNKEGEKQLQFPIENPNIGTYLKAGIFGKWSLPTAQNYSRTLTAKQTKTYQESQLPYKQYKDYLEQDLKNNEEKINYINNQDWNENQKWGIYINDIFSDTERKENKGSQLSDAQYITSNGVSKSKYIKLYNKAKASNIDMPTGTEYKSMKSSGINLEHYIDYKININNTTKEKKANKELTEDGKLKDKDKIQLLLDSNYSQKETTALYENYVLSSSDEKYDIVKKFFTEDGLNINKYLKYKAQGFEADKEDDGTFDGKSVSGSKKKKVLNYINSIEGATYTQKLILYALEYKPESRSDRDLVINYIRSLPNKSDNEKFEMLGAFKWITRYEDGRYGYK